MSVKPIKVKQGYATTEFWLSVATVLGSLVASLAEVLPAKYAAIATVLSTAIYTLARAFTKGKAAE